SSVKVSWMLSSLAGRQAPSGPTATKPMVTGPSEPEPPPVSESAEEQAARAAATRPAALAPRTVRRVGFMDLLLETCVPAWPQAGTVTSRGCWRAADRRAVFLKC